MTNLVSVEVGDVRPTIRSIEATLLGGQVAALQGLLKVARDIQSRARSNMATRHYDGRAEKAVTVWTSVKSSDYVQVKVGIRGNTFAPEGKTFEVGWRSAKGLQPPTQPLADWALRRGLASDERSAKRIGFAIARKMKTEGYSFGEFHWLTDAAEAERPTVEATVQRYMLGAWSAQPRVPAGSPGGGRFMAFG